MDGGGHRCVVVCGADGGVEAIVEYKAATEAQRAIKETNSGIYCFDAALLWKYIDSITTNNPAGEFYLTDMVEILRSHGHRVDGQIMADSSELLGINTKVELAEVDRLFRVRKNTQLMLDGVTIERPETVTIDSDVRIGTDTSIAPFAQITGNTATNTGLGWRGGGIRLDSETDSHLTTSGSCPPYVSGNTPDQVFQLWTGTDVCVPV